MRIMMPLRWATGLRSEYGGQAAIVCLLRRGPSSQKIEPVRDESVPFRVLAANQHPDHDTIATFGRRHVTALSKLLVQVVQLCRQAGLVTLGHVALASAGRSNSRKASDKRRAKRSGAASPFPPKPAIPLKGATHSRSSATPCIMATSLGMGTTIRALTNR